jgi:hypothetical protein
MMRRVRGHGGAKIYLTWRVYGPPDISFYAPDRHLKSLYQFPGKIETFSIQSINDAIRRRTSIGTDPLTSAITATAPCCHGDKWYSPKGDFHDQADAK